MTLLVLAAGFAVAFAVYFVVRFTASFPGLPAPGPETSELGPEAPAIANLLVNRCHVTSAAAAATLVDLAARRHLELLELDPTHFVVRLRQGPDEQLTGYEDQVMSLVRQKAAGGSAPLEAIELDESDAEPWRKRFARYVVDDARGRGLLRGRWSRTDWVIFGVLTAAVLLAIAGGLFLANVEDKADTKGDRSFDRETWFIVAVVGWFVVMAALRRLRSIRYSAAGEAAAARWLGVKRFLVRDAAFGDTPPAGVAIWNRLLAYGAAIGAAHGAVAAIPLEEEDPDVAWSRVGGNWRQVHVEYPKRFGYGERPIEVFLNGALRVVLWGLCAFVVLPIAVNLVWDIAADGFETASDGATFGFVVGFLLAFVAVAVFLLVHLADATIRAYRGLADLRRTVTVDGQVVKHHVVEGVRWFAVDPGRVDEVKACRPGDDGAYPPRGANVRMVLTPHLRHVVSVNVVAPQHPSGADGR